MKGTIIHSRSGPKFPFAHHIPRAFRNTENMFWKRKAPNDANRTRFYRHFWAVSKHTNWQSCHADWKEIVLWCVHPGDLFDSEDEYDFKVEKWTKLLKDNWIQTVGTLTRIPPGQLGQLGLPLALVVELERIIRIATDVKTNEFFHLIKDVCLQQCQFFTFQDASGTNKRFQLKLSPGQKVWTSGHS